MSWQRTRSCTRRRPITRAIDVDTTETIVEVSDGKATNVRPRDVAFGGGGYGLHMVEAIAETWGTQTHGTAKAVWAAIACARGI